MATAAARKHTRKVRAAEAVLGPGAELRARAAEVRRRAENDLRSAIAKYGDASIQAQALEMQAAELEVVHRSAKAAGTAA